VALTAPALLGVAAIVVAVAAPQTAALAALLALGVLVLAGAPGPLLAANLALKPARTPSTGVTSSARRSLRESECLVVGITAAMQDTTKILRRAVLEATVPRS